MKKKWATGKEVTSYKIHTLIVSFENKCTVPIRGGRGEEANFEVLRSKCHFVSNF